MPKRKGKERKPEYEVRVGQCMGFCVAIHYPGVNGCPYSFGQWQHARRLGQSVSSAKREALRDAGIYQDGLYAGIRHAERSFGVGFGETLGDAKARRAKDA